jgi:mannosyltransferase OCH1-like enzyme
MVFIENVLPRYNILINNKYDIINTSNDDFHIVIYYISEDKCKIIIRRLDENCGWGVNLKILLYDNDDINKTEQISLGSSYLNHKIIYVYTHIKLEQTKYRIQGIPKIIFQTTFDKNITNISHHNSILTILELNPEYEYRLLDDNECRDFIKNNFDNNILSAYDLIVPGAYKSDLFRYCYLYVNGGCYFDCKMILRKPLHKIINPDDDLILCKDIKEGYYNAVMMSSKENNKLLIVINDCVNKIHDICKINLTDYYDNHLKRYINNQDALWLTGPIHLYYSIKNFINEDHVAKLEHKHMRKNRKNINIKHTYQELYVEYNNEIVITKFYNGYNNPSNHYSKLFEEKKIIYKNIVIIDKYKFLLHPYLTNDTFHFYIFNNNTIIIERIDINSGWSNNINLKIIEDDINKTHNINVNKSDNKYKIISVDNIFDKPNLIKYYMNTNNEYNDTFDVNIVEHNNIYKMIVIRSDLNTGWGQNLELFVKMYDDKEYTFLIGQSDYNVKIITIHL